jgi:aspartate aminotransferase-like enzyme
MKYPARIEDATFRKVLRESYRTTVAGGQAQLKGKIFRIGHMGICSLEDIEEGFRSIAATLADMGRKPAAGAVNKATRNP